MILSVKQAKKKWCPMRGNEDCIADRCMFWQWVGFRPQSAPEKFTHKELLDAGVDPGALVKGREITLPPMQPQYAALSGMAARVSNVWRDAATKECFVSLDIIGGDERVGRCGLCQPEVVAQC